LGLLQAIHPALRWDGWLRLHLERLESPAFDLGWELKPGSQPGDLEAATWNSAPLKRLLAYLLWLIRLPEAEAASVADRLKIARQLTGEVLAAGRLYRLLPELEEQPHSAVASQLDEFSPLAVAAVYQAAPGDRQRSLLHRYMTSWRSAAPTISGDDLRARGIPPGPVYRVILSRLRAAWIDGEVQNLEAEQRLLEQLLVEAGAGRHG
jgi:tRNA nucleotidyltransferase (CCA-adding enzyme)